MPKPITAETVARYIEISEKWHRATDHTRSEFRAKAVGRIILFWERVRRLHHWTPISALYPRGDDAERRWVRRNCYTLEIAGLIETRPASRITTAHPSMEIRVKQQ